VAVEQRGSGLRAQEGVSSSMQMGFGHHKVGHIAVHPQDHVTGMEINDSIWMGGVIIEQICEGLHGSFGSIELGGKGAKGNKHSGSTAWLCIVEENTDVLLNVFTVSSIKCTHVVRIQGVLDFCTIGWLLPSMWCMFGSLGV